MDRDEILRIKTHKEENLDVGRRVYYTITNAGDNVISRTIDPTQHNTAKLLSLLIAKLSANGQLSETDLDDLLLQMLG